MIFNKDSKTLFDDLACNSIHAVVTDPAYGLHIMGQDWDKILPPQEIWDACFEVVCPGAFLLAFGHTRLYHRLGCQLEDAGFVIKDCLCWCYATSFPHSYDVSAAGEEWNGWGTQLKTAWEPIILAQKPLEDTYVNNIIKYKVGALNIDVCRIPYASEEDRRSLESFVNFERKNHGDKKYFSANEGGKKQVNIHPDGRWPANLLWLDPLYANYDRMFMIPKPSKKEKGEYNTHPTVKPVKLMERLINLVTPRPSLVKQDITVLDPFCGSGTTGKACKTLGRSFVGYEDDEESFNIAQKRLSEKASIGDIFER